VGKKDTVRTLIEEVLKDYGKQLKDKGINIIKKQFEKDLPDTTMPMRNSDMSGDSDSAHHPHRAQVCRPRFFNETIRSRGRKWRRTDWAAER